jgi:hypothetical protein
MPKLLVLIVVFFMCTACGSNPTQPATPAPFSQLATAPALSTPVAPSSSPVLAVTRVPTSVPATGPEARPDPMPPTREPLLTLPEAKLEWNDAKNSVTVKHSALGVVGPMCASFELVNQPVTIWTSVTPQEPVSLFFDGQLVLVSEGPEVYVDLEYMDWHRNESVQAGDFSDCVDWAWDRIIRTNANNDIVHFFVIRMDGKVEEQTTIYGKGG